MHILATLPCAMEFPPSLSLVWSYHGLKGCILFSD
jgi:hypothetical protein